MNEIFEKMDLGSKDFPIGIFTQNRYVDEPHHHLEYELFYLVEGQCIFGIDGKENLINKGAIIFLNPGINHYVKKIAGDTYKYYAMMFDSSVIGPEDDICRRKFDSIRINRFLELPEHILQRIIYSTEMNDKKNEGYEISVKAVLFDILSYILYSKQYEIVSILNSKGKHRVSAIETALIYIQEHFKENIKLSDILKITNYSKSHFIRLFKDSTGSNVTDYINKYRIEKACLQLIYTDKNITEIASENGFNNIQYFSRTFKEYMQCTPKQYQKKGAHLVVPPSSLV